MNVGNISSVPNEMAAAEPGTTSSPVVPCVSELLPSAADGIDTASDTGSGMALDACKRGEVPTVASLLAKVQDHKCEMCGQTSEDLCLLTYTTRVAC